jgi:hypothetical protein
MDDPKRRIGDLEDSSMPFTARACLSPMLNLDNIFCNRPDGFLGKSASLNPGLSSGGPSAKKSINSLAAAETVCGS